MNIDWIEGDPSPEFLSLVCSILEEFPDDAREHLARVGLAVSQEIVNGDSGVIGGQCWGHGSIVLYERALTRGRDEVKHVILHELAHSLGASEKTVAQIGY